MKQTSCKSFIMSAAFGAVAFAAAPALEAVASLPTPRNALPRWRGFNYGFWKPQTRENLEDIFRMTRDLSFDFMRVNVGNKSWVEHYLQKSPHMDRGNAFKIKESGLAQMDLIIELGRKYKVHVNLDLHHGPGWSSGMLQGNFVSAANPVNYEPFSLWQDQDCEDAFVFHWDLLANRYKEFTAEDLSFNLLNEPKLKTGNSSDLERFYCTREDYRRVMTRTANTIRKYCPERITIIDGLDWGGKSVYEMIPPGVAQSLHFYAPGELTHYGTRTRPVGPDNPPPQWPMKLRNGSIFDRGKMKELLEPWRLLVYQGIGVHCGEMGCYNKTSHDVFLRWLTDLLDILKENNIGWSLFNLYADFGLLDSGRTDVAYEDKS